MVDKKQIKPFWWWILGIISLCLLCYAIIPVTPWCLGLERKDAITALIALGGVVAVVIGIFQTQSRITKQEKQFKDQTELQQKQQRDARFASGVELLGNPHESTRIGGAYNLYFLARDYEEYRTPVCEILCAHLRTVANKKKFQTEEECKNYPHNEVQAIIDLLFRKNENKVFIFRGNRKYLNDIFLFEVSFFWGDYVKNIELHNVIFDNSKLVNINWTEVLFANVFFNGAELDYVYFNSAILNIVIFDKAKLLNVFFNDAKFSNAFFNSARIHIVDFTGTSLEGYDIVEITKDRREDS